jgi:hypothetical protein
MKLIRSLVIFGLLLCAAVCTATPASADGTTCGSGTDGYTVHTKCVKSAARTHAYIVAHSEHTFAVDKACKTDNATCPATPTCRDGLVYNIFEDGVKLAWQACLSQDQADRINGLTPGLVRRAFRRLSWPASELVVQPPKGRTLVNFDTNFYTTNDHPITRTVTLIGQRVTIEATPRQYTWHFGDTLDDSGALSTTDPGAAYPDLRVTHRYARVGDVRPSVDTTYSGRYRVGNGRWQPIPDTLTVAGAAVDLQVVSATPHLVGY